MVKYGGGSMCCGDTFYQQRQILRRKLVPYLRLDQNFTFPYDNDPNKTAKATMKWLKTPKHECARMVQSSLDLNLQFCQEESVKISESRCAELIAVVLQSTDSGPEYVWNQEMSVCRLIVNWLSYVFHKQGREKACIGTWWAKSAAVWITALDDTVEHPTSVTSINNVDTNLPPPAIINTCLPSVSTALQIEPVVPHKWGSVVHQTTHLEIMAFSPGSDPRKLPCLQRECWCAQSMC